jgi:hypothetical protein
VNATDDGAGGIGRLRNHIGCGIPTALREGRMAETRTFGTVTPALVAATPANNGHLLLVAVKPHWDAVQFCIWWCRIFRLHGRFGRCPFG